MIEKVYLAEGVFACVTVGHAVFLDLNRDAYSAAPLDRSRRAPAGGQAQTCADLIGDLASERQALLEAGLLTVDPQKAAFTDALCSSEAPAKHIFGLSDARLFGLAGAAAADVSVSLRDLFDVFQASAAASRRLRRHAISAIVADVRRRKETAGDRLDDLEGLRREAAVFSRLRPWYPRAYLCLFDSLALVEFLARRSRYPRWVFAVQMQPFGAHCWLEADGYLLNESTEYAGGFTPIMAV